MTWLISIALGFFGKFKSYFLIGLAVAGAVAVGIGEVFMAGKKSERADELQKEEKENAQFQDTVTDSIKAGNDSLAKSESGGLRDDDGFKRKS